MFKVLLPVLECRLPKLCRHLRRRIVHELSILAKEVPRRPSLLLMLMLLMLLLRVGVAVAALLGLRRYRRRG